MDIFLKSLSDFKWETSSKERVASGANPNSQWKHLVAVALLPFPLLNPPLGSLYLFSFFFIFSDEPGRLLSLPYGMGYTGLADCQHQRTLQFP